MKNSSMQPLVFIVILNWNGREDTLACLESVSAINYRNYRILVADNGSDDGSIEAIRRTYPDVEIIANGANLGFAEGNNRAIARAIELSAEFVLLLNNDTVVDSTILAAFLYASVRMPEFGVFGAKIYHFDDKQLIWYAGGYWDDRTLSFNEFGAGQIDRGQFDELRETEWVIGCAMFIRAEVFAKVGLLESSFFLNNEEIDFCSRAKRAGLKCAYVPEARLWHKISASFGGEDSPLKVYFSSRNRLLWAKRNAALTLRLRIYADSSMSLICRFARPLLGRGIGGPLTPRSWWWALHSAVRDPRNRAAALGVMDFWRGRFGNCPDAVRTLARDWAEGRPKMMPASTAPDRT